MCHSSDIRKQMYLICTDYIRPSSTCALYITSPPPLTLSQEYPYRGTTHGCRAKVYLSANAAVADGVDAAQAARNLRLRLQHCSYIFLCFVYVRSSQRGSPLQLLTMYRQPHTRHLRFQYTDRYMQVKTHHQFLPAIGLISSLVPPRPCLRGDQ